jgi:antitoxin ParD1/3/4
MLGFRMISTRRLNLDLPEEVAVRLEARMASGSYASQGDVIRDGLDALDQREVPLEEWMHDEVRQTYARYMRGEVELLSLDVVKAHMAAHMDAEERRHNTP